MDHKFVILIGGELHTYDKYEDIPEEIDNVIEFLPAIPPAPHDEAGHDHAEISEWDQKLKELMKREGTYASSN